MAEKRAGLPAGLTVLFVVMTLALCGATGVVGFVMGRSVRAEPGAVAPPTPRAEAQVIEVTRMATVVVPATGAAGAPPAQVVPAATPAPPGSNGSNSAETEPPTPFPSPTFRPGQPGDFTEEDLAILFEAWSLIEQDFDGAIPADDELRYGIVEYVLGTLGDEFTRFVRPETAIRGREIQSGSFEGIGALVRQNEANQLEIVRPFDGQPADLAGIKAGDVVIAVDGVSVLGWSLDETVDVIRGPRGTDVTLTVVRQGQATPFEVTITRALIEIPVLEAELLPQNIAYVRLTTFAQRNVEEQLQVALEGLLAEQPAGIILDLRDNGGGFLDMSIAVADLFLPDGVVLFERNRTGLDVTYRSEDGDLAESLPLVVLVNAGSASASEIVAGAIRDRGRGVLIGETTFGKGSVQRVYELSDQSEVRITIARWYTPDNHSIDGVGVAPDIVIPTPEDLGGEDDTQLQRAIGFILNGE